MSDDVLETYVIYDRPSDYPDGFPVRRFEWATPKEIVGIGTSLEHARTFIPVGAVNLQRNPHDDPKIIEVWI